MDKRIINDLYSEMARKLIEEEPSLEPIKNSDATIIFLSSEHKKRNKGKLVLGECEKVSEKYKWGIPCDYTITIFEPNVEGMTEEQISILLFHELLHIGITEEGRKTIVGHDLEDFKEIIDRFGTDWAKVV